MTSVGSCGHLINITENDRKQMSHVTVLEKLRNSKQLVGWMSCSKAVFKTLFLPIVCERSVFLHLKNTTSGPKSPQTAIPSLGHQKQPPSLISCPLFQGTVPISASNLWLNNAALSSLQEGMCSYNQHPTVDFHSWGQGENYPSGIDVHTWSLFKQLSGIWLPVTLPRTTLSCC